MDTGDTWHLTDGEKQLTRDAAMKKVAAMANDTGAVTSRLKNLNRWSDDEFQP